MGGTPMFTLIKGGQVFSPRDLGIKDILVVGGTIAKLSDRIEPPADWDAQIIDATGYRITPGWIDLHVHLLGGGGEGGFRTRTPEIRLSKITRAGVTTVVGCLGTDDVSRKPETLLAKAMQLEEEGISTYIYSGSYQFPMATITGRVRKDIALIPKVIGVGEIAISDHRSSQPTHDELCRVASEARVGGMVGGKAGLVHLHVGDGPRMLEPLFRMVNETEIPIGQFLPTHLNRNQGLLEQAIEYANRGGFIDFTVQAPGSPVSLTTSKALKKVLEKGVAIEQITLSSDSNGSMPVFDEKGKVITLTVADIKNLHTDCQGLIQDGFDMEAVLNMVTTNPAKRLGLFNRKGSIEEGKDADLLMVTRELDIVSVMAKGQWMVQEGEVLKKGSFED